MFVGMTLVSFKKIEKEFLAPKQIHLRWLRLLTVVIGFYTLHTKWFEYEKKMIQQHVSKMKLKCIVYWFFFILNVCKGVFTPAKNKYLCCTSSLEKIQVYDIYLYSIFLGNNRKETVTKLIFDTNNQYILQVFV